jgi:hypothetical protein
MSTEHTKTPWHVNGIDTIMSVSGNRSIAKVYHPDDDAAFIVLSANCHDKFVVALSRIQGLADQAMREPKWALQNCDAIEEIVRTALKNAGGK